MNFLIINDMYLFPWKYSRGVSFLQKSLFDPVSEIDVGGCFRKIKIQYMLYCKFTLPGNINLIQ